MTLHHQSFHRRPPPAVNAPAIVLGLIGLLFLVHLLAHYVLSSRVANSFAFVPLRFTSDNPALDQAFWGGAVTKWLSPVTHMLLHADWMHLTLNSAWLLVFGAPVARRMGPARFLALFILSGLAGAAAHTALNWSAVASSGYSLLVGASGAISGLMGAAARFVFLSRDMVTTTQHRPLLPFGHNQVVTFTVLWTALNFVFALSGGLGLVQDYAISWEAHLGGYFAGLLLIGPLDRPIGRV